VITYLSHFHSPLNAVPAGNGSLIDIYAKKLARKSFFLAAMSFALCWPAASFAGDTCRQEKDGNGGTVTICCDNSGTCYRKQ
jgi:hypothetical protein